MAGASDAEDRRDDLRLDGDSRGRRMEPWRSGAPVPAGAQGLSAHAAASARSRRPPIAHRPHAGGDRCAPPRSRQFPAAGARTRGAGYREGDPLPAAWLTLYFLPRVAADSAAARWEPAGYRRGPAGPAAPAHVRGRARAVPPRPAPRRDRPARDPAGRHLAEARRHGHARVRHRDQLRVRRRRLAGRGRAPHGVFATRRSQARATRRRRARASPDRRRVAATRHARPGHAIPLLGPHLQQPPHTLRPGLGDGGRGLSRPRRARTAHHNAPHRLRPRPESRTPHRRLRPRRARRSSTPRRSSFADVQRGTGAASCGPSPPRAPWR